MFNRNLPVFCNSFSNKVFIGRRTPWRAETKRYSLSEMRERGDQVFWYFEYQLHLQRLAVRSIQTGSTKDALIIKMASGLPTYGTTFKLEHCWIKTVKASLKIWLQELGKTFRCKGGVREEAAIERSRPYKKNKKLRSSQCPCLPHRSHTQPAQYQGEKRENTVTLPTSPMFRRQMESKTNWHNWIGFLPYDSIFHCQQLTMKIIPIPRYQRCIPIYQKKIKELLNCHNKKEKKKYCL